jgi:hypothetical protein
MGLLDRIADDASMGAYITVSDAAGRVLFRRPATDDEVMSALQAAQTCEVESQAALDRIAQERSDAAAAEMAVAAEAAGAADAAAAAADTDAPANGK